MTSAWAVTWAGSCAMISYHCPHTIRAHLYDTLGPHFSSQRGRGHTVCRSPEDSVEDLVVEFSWQWQMWSVLGRQLCPRLGIVRIRAGL